MILQVVALHSCLSLSFLTDLSLFYAACNIIGWWVSEGLGRNILGRLHRAPHASQHTLTADGVKIL